MATKKFKTAALVGLASFLAFIPFQSKSQEYAYIPVPKATISDSVQGMTFPPLEHPRSYDTNFASETISPQTSIREYIELDDKSPTLEKIALSRIERNVEIRINSGPVRINHAFTFYSLKRDQIKYTLEDFNARMGRGIFRNAGEEALRSWAVQTFGIGGSLGETVEGFSDSYSISSPFRANEGNPGAIYNAKSRWHLSFKIWDDNPEVSFKHHLGIKNQFNLRANMDGAEAIFVRPEIFANIDFVAGAKLKDYDYHEGKVYLGINWKRSDNEYFNLGATLNNHLNLGNPVTDKDKAGAMISISYNKKL